MINAAAAKPMTRAGRNAMSCATPKARCKPKACGQVTVAIAAATTTADATTRVIRRALHCGEGDEPPCVSWVRGSLVTGMNLVFTEDLKGRRIASSRIPDSYIAMPILTGAQLIPLDAVLRRR
jgi:hypothetical protein